MEDSITSEFVKSTNSATTQGKSSLTQGACRLIMWLLSGNQLVGGR